MISAKEPEAAGTTCIFGAQRILPRLDAFLNEIEGVRSARDIEHIHRMRVASRRLRAAIPLFGSCFPPKKFRRWVRELQKISQALGDARDTDVQIAFLLHLKEKKAKKNIPDPARQPLQTDDAETILLTRLQKKRQKLQNTVLSAIENLERSRIPEDIRAECTFLLANAKQARAKPAVSGIPAVAATRISRRLDILLGYERWVYNPDAVAEHHAMRIAAKKLRYTMETYAPVYRRNLKKSLARIKKIQEILGDLHDCDVWIDTVMAMLLDERTSPGTDFTTHTIQGSRVTSYRHFLSERENERKRIYRRFVRYWESVRRTGLWDELRRTLIVGRKVRFSLPDVSSTDAIRSSVYTLSGKFPQGIPHVRSVTALALRIFDDLLPLHQMGAHERFLLECASSLHDIGLMNGQKGHAERSREIIISDDTLPIDIIDRGIVALVSRAHRGKVRLESDGFFSLLSSEQQKNVRMLASLIRVADGLDDRHLGSITTVHCSPGPHEVVIVTSGMRDASAEIEQALKKGDLFRQVFERTLVIR